MPIGVVIAGEVPQPPAPQTTATEPEQQALLDELDEVLVSGERPVKSAQQVINWLASLAGKFTLEGNVDAEGENNHEDPRPVQGSANCIAFGLAPGVRCELRVHWPEARGPNGEAILGGVSSLDPGMILYGLEPRSNGISYMIVDNKGVGDHAVGLLFNNTLISKTACVNVPGPCQRVVRITVEPQLQVIRMQIDLERAEQEVVRFGFVMRRVPGSKADVILVSAK
jgi:hypothetical protein